MDKRNVNIFLNRADFARELIAIWRVGLAVVLIQILAGCATIHIGRFGHWFVDFWFGGAIATIVGFWVGLIWQSKASRHSLVHHRPILLVLGCISIVLFVTAFFIALDQMAGDLRHDQGINDVNNKGCCEWVSDSEPIRLRP
jgi:hypothetical protein